MRNSKWNGLAKKAIMAFSFMLCTMVMAGCGDIMKNNQDAKQWKKDAKILAQQYVEDKYGFTNVSIVGAVSLNTSSDPFELGKKSSQTVVNMYANGKKFTVEVDALDEDNSETRDDYQKDEICQAIKEVIEEVSANSVLDVTVTYWTPFKRHNYLAHDKYEVSDDATAYEKAESLRKIFNKQYEKNATSSNLGYSTVIIYAYFIGDDLSALDEAEYLAKDILGFQDMYMYEIECRNEDDYQSAHRMMNTNPSLPKGVDLYLNGYSQYKKEGAYLGETKKVECIKFSFQGMDCVLSGSDLTEEDILSANLIVEDAPSLFTDDRGKARETISDLYKVSIPKSSRLTVFFTNASSKNKCVIGKKHFQEQRSGKILEKKSIYELHSSSGYCYDCFVDGDEICLLKE